MMLKAVEMKIVTGDSAQEVAEGVNRLLSKGYTLHGSLNVVYASAGLTYTHALVKVEPVEVPGMSPLAMGGPMPMPPGGPLFVR